MENTEIRERFSDKEYNIIKQHKDFKTHNGVPTLIFNIDEFMGFTKCRVTIDTDHNLFYEEAFILGKDKPYKKCTDSRILKHVNYSINLMLEGENYK